MLLHKTKQHAADAQRKMESENTRFTGILQLPHEHFGSGFGLYKRPCPVHAGHTGTDRSLLTGRNSLFVRYIARIFYMHYHMTLPLVNRSVALVGAS